MNTIFGILDKHSPKYIWRLTLGILLLISVVSALFIQSAALELFYILPITLASWYGSRKAGILLALIATALLIAIRIFHTHWNTLVFLSYGLPCAIGFVTLAVLISNFRDAHREESEAADTDTLTNIGNARSFYVDLANELLRSSRYEHTFSLAYLDIDNFKLVNDSRGHAEGDKLLIEVANSLKEALRETDVVARLGGDEFACLLPEAHQAEAKAAFKKASDLLKQRMASRLWPVTFSVGVVTFETMPVDIKEAMKVADELMYSVKHSEKNNISYQVWHSTI